MKNQKFALVKQLLDLAGAFFPILFLLEVLLMICFLDFSVKTQKNGWVLRVELDKSFQKMV